MNRAWLRRLSGVSALALVAVFAAIVLPPAHSARAACPLAAPDERSAARQAATCGGRVEAMSGRTPYGRVFADSDGRFTVEQTLVPTQVPKPDGSWVPVDPTLVASGNGWAPRASLAHVLISKGGSGPFVTYSTPGGDNVSLSWPYGPLPVPVISGATARFPNVLSGVDLWVVVTSTGFRPVLSVANADAAADPRLRSVSYGVDGTLHIAPLPGGRVRFADARDNTALVTDPAVMWDSTVDPSTGEGDSGDALVSSAERAGDTARVGDVAVTAGRNDLTIQPDLAMLSDPATRFPVFIDPSISPSQSKWAYADSANANNTTDKARVGKDPDSGTLYRSFFNFSTTQGSLTWRGKRILSAEFDIELYHSYACSDSEDDWTFASNVATITTSSSRMPWDGSGSRWLPGAGSVGAQGHANKAGGCGGVAQPDVLVTFAGSAMLNQVQHVANENFTTYAIGLCACNGNGSGETGTYRWKKFYIDSRAKLIVNYDTIPGTPANLTTAGAACGSNIGTTSPTLSAQMLDADTDDTLSATFTYQQLPSGLPVSVTHTGIPANNTNTLTLSGLVDGATYQWQVQTTDKAKFSSPVSAWCSFTVIASAPPLPVVTATGTPSYGACDPVVIDTCHPAGSPGIAGLFTLSPNGAANVTSFSYGWSSPPSTTVSVAPGASTTINVTPPHAGLNTLYVSSSNGVKRSGIFPYQFLVDSPSGPVADWPLDDILGGFTDRVSGATMTVNSGVSWTPDVHYVGASSATFSGDQATGYASQAVPQFDTSKSFSVGAWVRTLILVPGNRTAVGQDAGGTGDNSPFYLGLRFNGTTPYWSFMLQNTSSSTGGGVAIFSAPLNSSILGKWVYLVGTFDAAQKTMSLYVNGALAATAAWTATPWRATGPVSVGHARFSGVNADSFVGNIADVRLWNRVVTPDDLLGVDADPAMGVPQSLPGLMDPVQVGSWDFDNTVDCGCDHANSGAFLGHPLYLDQGWINDPPTSAFTVDSQDGEGGLQTDGVAGNASTTTPDLLAHPVLRTDQSFTLSVWVKLDSLVTRNATVLSQDGVTDSPFYLGYNYAHSSQPGWSLRLVPADVTGPAFNVTWAPASDTEWTHLIAVYDAVAATNTLYVNGVRVDQVTAPQPFVATGSLRVGAVLYNGHLGDFFPGLIDQVQVWQGVLSARQLADLDPPTQQ